MNSVAGNYLFTQPGPVRCRRLVPSPCFPVEIHGWSVVVGMIGSVRGGAVGTVPDTRSECGRQQTPYLPESGHMSWRRRAFGGAGSENRQGAVSQMSLTNGARNDFTVVRSQRAGRGSVDASLWLGKTASAKGGRHDIEHLCTSPHFCHTGHSRGDLFVGLPYASYFIYLGRKLHGGA